jgi:hypothetical protein
VRVITLSRMYDPCALPRSSRSMLRGIGGLLERVTEGRVVRIKSKPSKYGDSVIYFLSLSSRAVPFQGGLLGLE